jgi:catechol-2,3-dioxygenase
LQVAWRPDEGNVYMTSGSDKLALHRRSEARLAAHPSLDHIGFALEDEAAVDVWHDHLSAQGVVVVQPPRTHRDGSRSFYCSDPEGNVVQLLFDPSLERESEAG